jgi:hypothetical protein
MSDANDTQNAKTEKQLARIDYDVLELYQQGRSKNEKERRRRRQRRKLG